MTPRVARKLCDKRAPDGKATASERRDPVELRKIGAGREFNPAWQRRLAVAHKTQRRVDVDRPSTIDIDCSLAEPGRARIPELKSGQWNADQGQIEPGRNSEVHLTRHFPIADAGGKSAHGDGLERSQKKFRELCAQLEFGRLQRAGEFDACDPRARPFEGNLTDLELERRQHSHRQNSGVGQLKQEWLGRFDRHQVTLLVAHAQSKRVHDHDGGRLVMGGGAQARMQGTVGSRAVPQRGQLEIQGECRGGLAVGELCFNAQQSGDAIAEGIRSLDVRELSRSVAGVSAEAGRHAQVAMIERLAAQGEAGVGKLRASS